MAVKLHPSLAGGPASRDILSGLPRELAFTAEEYRDRLDGVRLAMEEKDVDVLLVQEPSNVLYLSGYQSFSMYGGECFVLPLEGEPSLVVHPPELGTALLHSWLDQAVGYAAGESHEKFLAGHLRRQGFGTSRIGVEKASIGITARSHEDLLAALTEARFVDGSGIVSSTRVTKSPREIEYLRKSARITDKGMVAAIEAVAEGATDNDVAAAAAHAMLHAGSEYMSVSPIVTTGRRSGVLHSTHKRVPLRRGDSVLMEMGACYQRYTAPTMRTVSIGEPVDGVRRLADACLTALDNVIAAIRPGVTADTVAKAGWEGIDLAGPGLVFHGVFAYAVGASFPPGWGDGTASISLGNQTRLRQGMVFHHPVALRRLGEYGVAFSETTVITEDGCQPLTSVDRRLFVR